MRSHRPSSPASSQGVSTQLHRHKGRHSQSNTSSSPRTQRNPPGIERKAQTPTLLRIAWPSWVVRAVAQATRHAEAGHRGIHRQPASCTEIHKKYLAPERRLTYRELRLSATLASARSIRVRTYSAYAALSISAEAGPEISVQSRL